MLLLLPFNFNSIKVQLKLRIVLSAKDYLKFQFHKGTIKTRYNTCVEHSTSWFQFHKGTIKTCSNTILVTENKNFNSIKVQLKHVAIDCDIGARGFQFHKGTIKTCSNTILVTENKNFNSIKVQLKHVAIDCDIGARGFQFHKGTIKTLVTLKQII